MKNSSLLTVSHISKIIPVPQIIVKDVAIPTKFSQLKGLNIAQLSDFHLNMFLKLNYVEKAVEITNSLNPDIIVLTGDYVSYNAKAMYMLMPILEKLQAQYGVFAVLGNHDYWSDVGIIKDVFNQSKIKLLINQGENISIGSQSLYIAGIDDVWQGTPDLGKTLRHHQIETPILLLDHYPDTITDMSQHDDIFLQLSGHTHGGQVVLPLVQEVGRPYLGKRYRYGLHKVHDTYLYVNPGIGFGSWPIRIKRPPEITRFVLQ